MRRDFLQIDAELHHRFDKVRLSDYTTSSPLGKGSSNYYRRLAYGKATPFDSLSRHKELDRLLGMRLRRGGVSPKSCEETCKGAIDPAVEPNGTNVDASWHGACTETESELGDDSVLPRSLYICRRADENMIWSIVACHRVTILLPAKIAALIMLAEAAE